MSDKVDRELPQVQAKDGPTAKLGAFRTHADYGADEFHVHDDKSGQRFCMAGIRRWEVSARDFLRTYHFFQIGTVVVFCGESKGKKHKNCDLVFTRTDNGAWVASLEECGSVTGNVHMGDPVITALDELVQRG